jgi:hypothetical protein
MCRKLVQILTTNSQQHDSHDNMIFACPTFASTSGWTMKDIAGKTTTE